MCSSSSPPTIRSYITVDLILSTLVSLSLISYHVNCPKSILCHISCYVSNSMLINSNVRSKSLYCATLASMSPLQDLSFVTSVSQSLSCVMLLAMLASWDLSLATSFSTSVAYHVPSTKSCWSLVLVDWKHLFNHSNLLVKCLLLSIAWKTYFLVI